MREFVLYIAKALVDLPSQVSIKEVVGERTTVLELRVAREDLGKIIGKKGKTAQALRTLLNAVATKQNKHAVLEIIE
jgi:hypothetical protein